MGAIESASQVPLLCDFAQQIGEKSHIRNQHSPIANLEHPSALSLAICYARKVIDKADCIGMFQIGDRRMLIAYFRTEFVQARFVGQSPPWQRRGGRAIKKNAGGVVRSIHRWNLK